MITLLCIVILKFFLFYYHSLLLSFLQWIYVNTLDKKSWKIILLFWVPHLLFAAVLVNQYRHVYVYGYTTLPCIQRLLYELPLYLDKYKDIFLPFPIQNRRIPCMHYRMDFPFGYMNARFLSCSGNLQTPDSYTAFQGRCAKGFVEWSIDQANSGLVILFKVPLGSQKYYSCLNNKRRKERKWKKLKQKQ